MAAAPRFKVYNRDGEYIAACKLASDAAVLCAANGDGTTVRSSHPARFTIWTEGSEEIPAGESYDTAAEIMHQRISERRHTHD